MTKPHFTCLIALVATLGLSSCASLKDRFSSDEDSVDDVIAEGGEIDMSADAASEGSPLDDAAIDVSGDPSYQYDTVLMNIEVNKVTRPVVFQLYPEIAPKTVANFKQKILSGAYDGTAFHRVIPRYIAQAGDPLSKDSSDRSEWGTGGNDETLPAEISLPHRPGSVAMARLGDAQNPEKRSSAWQFYIALRSIPSLDDDYTVFGQVTQGLEVIEDISKTVVDSNDNPIRRADIASMQLVPATLTVEDPGALPSVGARTNTIPNSKKGPFTRFIERIW